MKQKTDCQQNLGVEITHYNYTCSICSLMSSSVCVMKSHVLTFGICIFSYSCFFPSLAWYIDFYSLIFGQSVSLLSKFISQTTNIRILFPIPSVNLCPLLLVVDLLSSLFMCMYVSPCLYSMCMLVHEEARRGCRNPQI